MNLGVVFFLPLTTPVAPTQTLCSSASRRPNTPAANLALRRLTASGSVTFPLRGYPTSYPSALNTHLVSRLKGAAVVPDGIACAQGQHTTPSSCSKRKRLGLEDCCYHNSLPQFVNTGVRAAGFLHGQQQPRNALAMHGVSQPPWRTCFHVRFFPSVHVMTRCG